VVADGVEGERQEIECHEKGGKVLLAVTVAVLEVIAASLESIERLVLDLPSGAATGGQFGDIVTVDGKSVIKLLQYETFPSVSSWISISNQLTLRASSPSRSGTSDSQR
jgi:hypothetical protein